MAIAFDAVAIGSVTSTSLTYSHTVTGVNVAIADAIGVNTAVDVIGTVKYATVDLARASTAVVPNSADQKPFLYYLIAPATGANNVVISSSSSVTIRSISMSYTGVKQTGQPDAVGSNTSAGTFVGGTITTIADNSWVISGEINDADFVKAGPGLTVQGSTNVVGGGDSGGAITPAGAATLTWFRQGSGNASWGMTMLSLAPVAAAGGGGPSGYKNLLGVGQA